MGFCALLAVALLGCDDRNAGPAETLRPVGEHAAVVVKAAGDLQQGFASAPLNESLVITVRTADGKPIAGAPVSWSVTRGGGKVEPVSGVTDRDGKVEAHWVLGDEAGEEDEATEQTVAVFVAGATPATFTALSRTVSSVSVSPSMTTLVVGASTTLKAQLLDAAGVGMTATTTWSSSNTSIATVSSTGKVTAKAMGMATITATSGTKRGQSVVTVTAAVTRSSGNDQLGTAGELLPKQLVAFVRDASGIGIGGVPVTWTVVSGGGSVRAISGVTDKVGRAFAEWRLGAASESQIAAVTVAGADPAVFTARAEGGSTVSIQPVHVELATGETVDLQAQLVDENGKVASGTSVTWSSSNTTVARVSSLGKVSAVSVGDATVTATTGGKTGQVAVAVKAGSIISKTSGDEQLALAGQLLGSPLVAHVRDAKGTAVAGATVTWKVVSGGGSITATAATTDNAGKAEARWKLGTSTSSQSVSVSVAGADAAVYTATPQVITSLKIDGARTAMTTGETADLKAQVLDASGAVISGVTPTWSTSSSAIASVTSAGKVTAVAAGKATITASAGGKTAQVAITVSAPVVSVATVAVSPSQGSLLPGATLELKAVARDASGNVVTTEPVTWASSATSVATVSGAGSTGTVKAVAAGSATVSATIGGKKAEAVITVAPTPPAPTGGVLPAFPGAEGWGAHALNASRTLPLKVHFVTTTAATGTGSLQAAIAATSSSTYDVIIFRTGGAFSPASADGIYLNNSHVYIAGQTAPAPVALAGRNSDATLSIRGAGDNVSDIVIRYLRIRAPRTGIAVVKGSRIVLDHLSMSWADRYQLAVMRYPSSWSQLISDVSIQRSIFAESLESHPTAVVIGATTQLDADKVVGTRNVSFHNNLSASNDRRSPLSSADNTLIAGNVIYNWRLGSVQMQHRGTHDVIGNFGRHGPLSRSDARVMAAPHCDAVHGYSVFASGNIGPVTQDPFASQWSGATRQVGCYWSTQPSGQAQEAPIPTKWQRTTPQAQNIPFPVQVTQATQAFSSVMADVGANARLTCEGNWVSATDAVDARILNEVRNGTGAKLGSLTSAPAMPSYAKGTPCADSDNDGLPDAWETRYFNCKTCAHPGTTGRNGYLLIEHYLNGTTP